MPELQNTSPDGGATPSPGTPATGTPASPGAMPAVKPATTLEEALARIADLEKSYSNKDEEAKRHFKNLSKYQEAEKAAQEAQLSENQKLAKQKEEAEQKYQQEHKQHINALVKLAAHAKGIIDPDIAALAIESQLEYGDDGKPSNLDKLLDDLLKNKPYLAKPAEQSGSPAQQRPPATPAMNPGRSTIVQPGGNTLSPKQWPKLGDGSIFRKE